MPSLRVMIVGLATASTISLGLISAPLMTGIATAADAPRDAAVAQPPDPDGPPLLYFPCNQLYDGAVTKWRGAWWKCEVVIDGDPKWQWEYWGNQNPNLA